MLVLHKLNMNPYADEMLEVLRQFDGNSLCPGVIVTIGAGWSLQTRLLRLEGTFKTARLKITRIDVFAPDGIDAIVALAKLCQGTLMGLSEIDWQPIVIERGKEKAMDVAGFYEMCQ